MTDYTLFCGYRFETAKHKLHVVPSKHFFKIF